jgi:hypothetical protein
MIIHAGTDSPEPAQLESLPIVPSHTSPAVPYRRAVCPTALYRSQDLEFPQVAPRA